MGLTCQKPEYQDVARDAGEIAGVFLAEAGTRIQPGRTGLDRGQEQPHRKAAGEKQGGFEGPPHFRIGFAETKQPVYYFFLLSAGHQVCGGCRLISFGLYKIDQKMPSFDAKTP
jgi:hypothetical protein